MELLPEIARRASVRSFTGEPLTDDQINRILEAARRAPSAKNRQPWRFIVITDPSRRQQIQDAAFGQEYVGQAPVVVAACTTNIEYKMPNGQLSYPVDLSMACGFMLLQVVHENLGACVVTTFREEDVKALLSVPYSMRVVMLVAIGHSDQTPDRSHRLPLDRIVSYNHW